MVASAAKVSTIMVSRRAWRIPPCSVVREELEEVSERSRSSYVFANRE